MSIAVNMADSGSGRSANAGKETQWNCAQNRGSNNTQYNARHITFNQSDGELSVRTYVLFHRAKADAEPSVRLERILPVAVQAPFDASDKQDDPLCLSDTRVDVLKHIKAWAYGEAPSRIFWLNGMAGTGKSTIARTISQRFHEDGVLAASFFFVRGRGELAQAGLLFTTLAAQIAQHIPAVKQHMIDVVHSDPDIASKNRTTQWKKLILEPLQKVIKAPTVLVIVIDALDECDNENDIKGIIRALADANTSDRVHLRIIVTSRPETPIRLGLGRTPTIVHHDLVLHDVPREIVDADICLFLYDFFEDIKQSQIWLGENWPSIDVVNHLVCLSGGLFIFAATVCRFLAESGDAGRALEMLVGGSGHSNTGFRRETFSKGSTTNYLDRMYLAILKRSQHLTAESTEPNKRPACHNIISVISALGDPLSPSALCELLSVSVSAIHTCLSGFHSVLRVPTGVDMPIRLFHTSFRDFLFDRARYDDNRFFVDEKNVHNYLALACINTMDGELKRNICRLEHFGILLKDVDKGIIGRCIPNHVQYACRQWVAHCKQAAIDGRLIFEFLQTHLLHWWEAMGLIGALPESVQMLSELHKTFVGSTAPITKRCTDKLLFFLAESRCRSFRLHSGCEPIYQFLF